MKSVDKYDNGTQLNSNEFNYLSKTLHERNHQNILLLMISAGIVFLVLVRSRKIVKRGMVSPATSTKHGRSSCWRDC